MAARTTPAPAGSRYAHRAPVARRGFRRPVPYANNAKIHEEDQITKLCGLIERFGWTSPIVVDKALAEFGRVLRETKVRVEDDRAAGVIPPDFVIDQSLVGMRAFIADGAAKNPLVTTLPAKLRIHSVLGRQNTSWARKETARRMVSTTISIPTVHSAMARGVSSLKLS
mgnify:CR=1 FL=1